MREEIYNQALRFLGYRFLSRKELADKLLHKGYVKEDIVPVLDRLEELEYLDDNRLAVSTANLYKSEQKYGLLYIRLKLKERGLWRQELFEDYDELEAAHRFIRKKRKLEAIISKAKLMRSLQNRGFTQLTIRQVMANWDEEKEEPSNE